MKLHTFKTIEINPIGARIYQVKLRPTEKKVFSFTAGQYIQLVMADGNSIPLSIASPSWQKDYLELHLKVLEGHPLAQEMLDHFNQSETVTIEGPFGHCTLSDKSCPAVLIAGGTGLSPMKSIVETALQNNTKRTIHLYFGAQTEDELYQNELLTRLAGKHQHFEYQPVLGEANKNWGGETGFPHQIAIRNLEGKINDVEFYISGSPAMVVAVYHDLVAAGAVKQHIHSDILDMQRASGTLD